jgi:hypothetical protein
MAGIQPRLLPNKSLFQRLELRIRVTPGGNGWQGWKLVWRPFADSLVFATCVYVVNKALIHRETPPEGIASWGF